MTPIAELPCTLAESAITFVNTAPSGPAAPPPTGAGTHTWTLLGRGEGAVVVSCESTALEGPSGTSAAQWLVFPAAPAKAWPIGGRNDASFDQRFVGPVTVARSRRVVTTVPVWEVCGPLSQAADDGVWTSANACELIVSAGAPPSHTGWSMAQLLLFPEGQATFHYTQHASLRQAIRASGSGWTFTDEWTPKGADTPIRRETPFRVEGGAFVFERFPYAVDEVRAWAGGQPSPAE